MRLHAIIPPSVVTFILLLLLTLNGCQEVLVVPEKGVTKQLAEERASQIGNLEYILSFHIPESLDSLVNGTATIRFTLDERPAKDLFLDFAGDTAYPLALQVNGSRKHADTRNQHIRIPRRRLREGANEITVGFAASNQALNRNANYLFTLFVPDKARTAFPCFDQPDLKATYTLSLKIPNDWIAVSNSAIRSSEPGSDSTVVIDFVTSKPISTYLFSFVAGRFTRVEGIIDGKVTAFYHREPDSVLVASNAPKLFELHSNAIAWLENYTGIEYPFGKFEFVLIPSFQYGGMEHPGDIFYRASSLLLQADASPAEQLRRASLIAHETTHMWFGDLVTMKWFDDVWLKEVFANFFAARIVNPEFPEIDHVSRFILTHYPRAMAVDRSSGTNPIKQNLENLENAGSLYGDIIYYKAPILMQQLEMLAGSQSFRSGILTYIHSHKYANASWEDLVSILDELVPVDVRLWSESWFFESGLPKFETLLEEHGQDSVKITIIRKTGSGVWDHAIQSFELSIASGNESRELRCDIKNDSNVYYLPMRSASEYWIPVLYDGDFYGEHVMSPIEVSRALSIVLKNPNRKIRSALWVDIHENFLNGRISSSAYLRTLESAISIEPSPVILSTLLDYLRECFWQFMAPDERLNASGPIEALLLKRSLEKGTGRLFFNAYRDLVTSSDGITQLADFWTNGHPRLTLNDNDNISLVVALAVRGYSGIDSIIEVQISRFSNPDLVDKFLFMQPVLSQNPGIWGSFIESLKDPVIRRHEVWVLESLRAIHHPLRKRHSIALLPDCIGMIEEVKRTGDIFFPRSWLDACLWAYQDNEALQVVTDFLDGHPGITPTLRGKIIQSCDLLERSLKMQPSGPELVSTGKEGLNVK